MLVATTLLPLLIILHQRQGRMRAATSKVPPDVLIKSSQDLPTFSPVDKLEVYYAEQIIQELGTVGELVETYHSGLTFRIPTKTTSKPQDAPQEFTVQWYALDFPFGAFLPSSDFNNSNDLIWNNTACAHYTPAIDPHRWTKGEHFVGTITGAQFSAFADWVVEYCQKRPGYQAFEVWDRPVLLTFSSSGTKRWATSNTCSSFSEAALCQLYDLGADFSNSKELLRRSYVPLISKTKPIEVAMGNPREAQLVREFYDKMHTAVMGESMTLPEFIRFLADKLDFFYVYQAETNHYLRVELSPPYMALTHFYQPMALPWQKREELERFVQDRQGASGFLTELSDAVEGGKDLLQRRLPPILARKMGVQSLVGLAVVPLVLFFVVSGSNSVINVDLDESFVAGVVVGLVSGLIGARWLPK